MAREVRDADVIGKAGVYLNESCNKLNVVKSSFIEHINNMQTNYQGVDAVAISNVLMNAINRVDELVNTLSYYSEYMLSVAKYDRDNIDNATKKIKSKNVTQPMLQPNDLLTNNNMGGEFIDESEQIKY